MAAKQLTLKQAEAELVKHGPEYKAYVAAQGERKDAASDKARKAAQRKMDGHRKGYTAYRNAYRAFRAAGGTRRKPGTGKPAATKSSGKGTGKRSGVKTTKLSKAAMKRRNAKTNPNGLTDKQRKAATDQVASEPESNDALSAAVTPNSEVVREGN